MADRLATPMVHTLHGPFDEMTSAFYARHGGKAALVALSKSQRSQAPPSLRNARVIPNPISVLEWPFRADHDGYLLWIGRMDPVKGPDRAIAAARAAGMPLVLAGPVQTGQEEFLAREVEPHVDGSAVKYVGEVGGDAKGDLYAGARALLMPIRWPEPFGLVMIEAMACGTPAIAFPEGAAVEVIEDGGCGFLVDDEEEMAKAIGRLDEIDPRACRESVARRFDVSTVVAAYELAYRSVAGDRRHGARPMRSRPSALIRTPA